MSEYVLAVMVVIVIIQMLGLAWLVSLYLKLKQDYAHIAEQCRRNNHDIAGLCSAALAVDEHLIRNDRQVYRLIEQVNELQSISTQAQSAATLSKAVNTEQFNQPESIGYDNVIKKIRLGVTVEELVKDCGLTRDEAVLLSRLHGRK